MNQMEGYFPTPHGVKRVDDQHVISGMIYVIKNRLRWKDALPVYGPISRCTTGLCAGACPGFST